VVAVLLFGIVDGSSWKTLLSPTVAYRPAVLFALTLVFGWRGFLWSQAVFLAAFLYFLGWRGAVFAAPLYLASHLCGFIAARALGRNQAWLTGERSTLAFLAGAGLAPAIPALLNGPLLSALHIAVHPGVPGPVESWLRGAAAMLALVPAVLVWCSGPLDEWVGLAAPPESRGKLTARNILELGFEIASWAVTLWITVHFKAHYGLNVTYLAFFPPLAFTLFRGMRLGTLALAANSVLATTLWSGMHWAAALPVDDLRLLIGVYSTTILVLAAVVEERWRQRTQIERLLRDEAVLRESERYFRSLADSAPVMIWVTGPDKLCTFVNRGWQEFTGRTPEFHLGYGWTEHIHSDDQDRCLSAYDSSFDARMKFEMEFRVHRADGVYRWVLARGIPKFSQNGEFSGYIGTCIDITHRKNAIDQLRDLSASMTAAQEEERRRISRQLHDDLLQRLGLMAMDLGKLASNTNASQAPLRERLQSLQEQAADAAELARHFADELHSLILEDFGIVTALRRLCEEFARDTELEVDFASSDLPHGLSRETVSCLYAVAHEALLNVAKHAHARRVRVQLAPSSGSIGLSIRDDGIGISNGAADSSTGFGILNMRERVRWVNGKFLLESTPGGGAQITVEVPIPDHVAV
jgi:PAS domain S-box-containing protein